MNFGRNVWNSTYRAWPTFVILPLWDHRGQADEGVFSNGDGKLCISAPGWTEYDRCLYLAWPKLWFAYGQPVSIRGSWQGTVLEDKRDGVGTLYRRNRSYDPKTGRFTQEDPIGLAGGMNAYGFANGDPVSYSDPYGLKVECKTTEACWQWYALRVLARDAMRSDNAAVAQAGRTLWGMIRDIESDEKHVLEVRVGQYYLPVMNWITGGGVTTPTSRVTRDGLGITRLSIDASYVERKLRVPRGLVLAHELGHAWALWAPGRDIDGSAVTAEDAYRTIHGCEKRESHANSLPVCIY